MLGTLAKLVLSAVLFAVFVPGVFFTVPVGNQIGVIAVHATLFAIANVLVWRIVKVVVK